MASTPAERARRYRRHRKGDHSLCDPARCDGNAPVAAPVTFGPRGRRLWKDMGGRELVGDRRVLLEEACRIADRLDRLERLLSGDTAEWFRLREVSGDLVVVVDRVLAESRQQAVALKQLIAELRQEVRPAEPAGPGPATVGAGIGDLTAKIAARRAQTAG